MHARAPAALVLVVGPSHSLSLSRSTTKNVSQPHSSCRCRKSAAVDVAVDTANVIYAILINL